MIFPAPAAIHTITKADLRISVKYQSADEGDRVKASTEWRSKFQTLFARVL
jgi:hypothetical protein